VRTNDLVVLFLAIVMGGVAAFLARSWLENHANASAGASVGSIVVTTQPLGLGTVINPENVVEIPWGAEKLPEGAFVSTAALFREGPRFVLSALDRNEPVLRSKITAPGQRASLSTLLEPGKRAVTVRVDDLRGVAGFILPRDFVDVVLISEDPAARRESYADILLHHVKVLAIDQLASERQQHPTVAKAVTIEVTPEQAQKILLATNIGRLSLVLRQPGDDNIVADRRVTERDLNRSRTPEPVRIAAPPPPPPPPPPAPPPPAPVAKVPDMAIVAIIRGIKREEYNVQRSGGGDPRESILRDHKLRQSSPTPKHARSTGRGGLITFQMIRAPRSGRLRIASFYGNALKFAASGR
jgi:pilus assembly protein CpaB